MDDPFLVRRSQAAGDLPGVVDGFTGRKRTIAEAIPQRLPFQQFGNYIGRSLDIADIENRKDVGVVETRGSTAFQRKSLQAVGIRGERFWKNLNGDVAVEPRGTGSVHLSHTARADGRMNFVGAEFCAGGQGHGWARLYSKTRLQGCVIGGLSAS